MTVKPITTTNNTITSQRPPYPIGVPDKFSPEGVLQRYAGNTTLCHLPPNSPLQPGLRALYEAVSSHKLLSQRFHLLPPESWHMTVLDGVREKERVHGMWPPGKEQQNLADCTEEFAQSLKQIGLQLEEEGLAPPYRMRVRAFDPALAGIGLEV